MKVYVAFCDDAGVWECVGVFSSPEKARETYPDSPGLYTQEHVVDERLEWVDGGIFRVVIDMRTGDLTRYTPDARKRHPSRCRLMPGPWDRPHAWVDSPISHEHAERVATAERRERLGDRDR